MNRDPIVERQKKTLESRVHEAALKSRLTTAELEKLLGIHLTEEELIRMNGLTLQLFCFNNPVNDHDRDGLCAALVEAVIFAITVGGVVWAIYKIKQKQDKLKELDPLSQEGAACMLDAAAGAVGDGVGGGGGPVSGAIVEKALQEAFKKCQKPCEKEDDKTCSGLKDLDEK